MSPRIRRRTLSIALLAAALPAPAQAATGWLQSPLLSVGGDLRGVGFGRGGGPQVIYGDTPGFGEEGAPSFERSVRRIPDGPWRAPEPSGLPAGLREVSINAAGNAVGWRRGLDPERSLVVSSFGTASRHDPGGWSAPRTLATGTRAAQVVLMDDGEALAAWSTQDGAVLAALRGRFGDWRPAARLEAPGSTPSGRVLIALRRPFGGRALAAFTVVGRRGANTVSVPRAALARLLGPGRYNVTAETGSRRPGGFRAVEVRLLAG
jgi:hypothetical protein